jgi:acyl-coenzyme A synthetase/AMP-(fatty) acid ligase
VDADGFLYIVGRSNDFVKCGGERVSCRKLEEQLLACDELVEAAVLGAPDPILGEAVHAFVVSRNGQHPGLEERLMEHCKRRLSTRLVPKKITVLSSLRKNSAGKIMKLDLPALA